MKYVLALGCALLLLAVIGCSSERITNSDTSATDSDTPAYKPPVIDNPPPGDPHELGGGFRGNEGDPAPKPPVIDNPPPGDPHELGGGFRGNEGDPDSAGDGLG